MRRIYGYIKDFVSTMGVDGWLHVFVSALLMAALGWVRPLIGAVIIVLSLGMGKEIYDYFTGKGMPEGKDLVCDGIGVLLGLIVILLNSMG